MVSSGYPPRDERNPDWLPGVGIVDAKLPGLETGRWRVVEIDGEPNFYAQELTFTLGQISGHDGCNSFSGQYRNQGEFFRYSHTHATVLGCRRFIDAEGDDRRTVPILDPNSFWQHMYAATRIYFPEPDILILSDGQNRRMALERID
jgi:hypothetical protein